MPKLVFSEEELKGYFSGQLTPEFILKAREEAEKIRVHADGLYPDKLIDAARPHEPAAVREYRRGIYQPKTKPVIGKILSSLSKIRRSSDWATEYVDAHFPRIPEGEDLKTYCEKQFPKFSSMTNWTFKVLLRQYLIDPNAVVAVLPMEKPQGETALNRPYPFIFSTEWVVDFVQDDYAVLENPKGHYYEEEGVWKKGRQFLLVTTQTVYTYNQTDSAPGYVLADEWPHGFNELPAFQIGAELVSDDGGDFLYASRIEGCLSGLNEAAREYSDLQAAVVQHLYPERWEIKTADCEACQGIGKIQTEGDTINCPTCKGSGAAEDSPYKKLIIKRELGEGNATIPAGYITKDVEIVRLQDSRFYKHIYDALAAVNMEFLAETPLAESGIAKEVDRDETNNFVHTVGEDLVAVMDKVYWFTARARYGVQYPDINEIARMVPYVHVPEHFDIFSTKYLEEELANAKEKKFHSAIVMVLEREYASKKFSAAPDAGEYARLILELDPLCGVTEDEKMTRMTSGGIAKADYVLSSNIQLFVRLALEEDKTFGKKGFTEQRGKLLELAKAIVDEAEAKAKELAAAVQQQQAQEEEDADLEQQQKVGEQKKAEGVEGDTHTGNQKQQPNQTK